MNYRHAYHAGSHTDVFKHAVLAMLLEHLRGKPKPFTVLDTHAGAGRYDLTAVEAGKTGEAADGIGASSARTSRPQRPISASSAISTRTDSVLIRGRRRSLPPSSATRTG